MNQRLTAVTGGIGSGKSVVCRVLRTMGYHVYDCDLQARRLMDADRSIHRRIAAEIHPECIVEMGGINRPRLAEIVFNDRDKLQALNAIVHAAVLSDLTEWRRRHDAPRLFVETAILNTSGLYRLVSDAWLVTAPQQLRIKRVERRSGLPAHETAARIASQEADAVPLIPYAEILNDNKEPLLPQILNLL